MTKRSLLGLAWLTAVFGLFSAACEPVSEQKAPAPIVAKSCQEACVDNADCNVGFVCLGQRCTYHGDVEVPQCSDDDSCVAIKSGWLELTPCDADHLCNFGECVVVNDAGRCVLSPPCTGLNQPVSWPSVSGGEVTVCGITDYHCSLGFCEKPCTQDVCSGSQPICADDGKCHCAEQSCAGSTRGEVCLANGRCGCSSDADCTAAAANKCYDGVCGCGSVEVCTGETLHVATQWVCE